MFMKHYPNCFGQMIFNNIDKGDYKPLIKSDLIEIETLFTIWTEFHNFWSKANEIEWKDWDWAKRLRLSSSNEIEQREWD